MGTIEDVCAISGVSRSTVNRFLAGQQVRGQNAKKIKSAMKELNYRPDKLAEKRNCTIEIIGGPGDSNLSFFHGFAEMFLTMVKYLEESGATVVIQPGYSKYIQRADGVIIYGLTADKEDEIIEILKLRGIPFVFAYREINCPDVSFVACDNYRAAYQMTETLINKGHKKIAVCGGDTISRNMPEKLQGFKDCMADHGIPLNQNLMNITNSEPVCRKWVEELFQSGEEFTAFFGLRDQLAIAFQEIAVSKGYKIPDDFSVVGMDGTTESICAKPMLTTVEIPFGEIGKEAARIIFELMDNPSLTCIRKYLKHSIALRDSH